MFSDRRHAGTLLSRPLLSYLLGDGEFKSEKTIVFALPRGGVPVAVAVALALGCPLSLLVSKKVPSPGNPELAIGAITADGLVVVDKNLCCMTGASPAYVEGQKKRLTAETRALEEKLFAASSLSRPENLDGKWAVVVDDGIATGMTACAALRSLRARGCARIVLAAPVVSFDAYHSLKAECDHLVTLSVPYDFGSVGQYYQDFHQVSEAEVVAALKESMQAGNIHS